MSIVMERSPSSFATIDEESLRTHFLVPLNANFRGMASGETFNAQGKTDILVKHQDRIFFIAECKFWTGPKNLTDAISHPAAHRPRVVADEVAEVAAKRDRDGLGPSAAQLDERILGALVAS